VAIEAQLGVYRLLDNRLRGESDESPFALELHERRRRALEDAFGPGGDIRVVDWGLTRDQRSHELVELVVGAVGSAALKYVVVPGLRVLGEKLLDLGAEKAASELVKAVVSRLRPKQEARAINDFSITIGETRIDVHPPDRGGTFTISAPDGTVVTIDPARQTS
jgi:hypothetical protein